MVGCKTVCRDLAHIFAQGLENDKKYTVQVKAFSYESKDGEPAKTEASPNTKYVHRFVASTKEQQNTALLHSLLRTYRDYLAVTSCSFYDRCKDIKPSRLNDLRVAPGDNMVELCWDGVENNACIDRYE